MITDNPDYPEYECELYDQEGSDYEQAWDIMREEIRIPPSLEGFQHGIGASTPQDYARYLISIRKK